MAKDPRLKKLRDAAVAMQRGQFQVEIPAGAGDEIARLGEALTGLARTLESRFAEIRRLAEVTEKVNAGLVLKEVLDFVYESFETLIPYDRIGLALLEADGRRLRARWARSKAPTLEITEGYAAAMRGSSLGRILDTGTPRILNDLEDYLRQHPESDSTRRIVKEGMRSSLTCPLTVRGRPTGFLFFSSMQPGAYREIHQGLFQQIAGQLSIIVEKSRLYEEMVELNRRLVEARNELAYRATHDSLTRLWNRGSIHEILDKELARAWRESRPLAVVMADLDRFKRINDERGHLAGDAVLREVATRLAGCLRESEYIGRYGGEEFLVLLWGCDEAAASRVMERMRAAVSATPVATPDGPVEVTVSLGAAVTKPVDGLIGEDLVRSADRALYRAKEAGRNCCRAEVLVRSEES